MSRRVRIAAKTVVWVACLAPVGALLWWFWTDDLGANPISLVTNTLGDWTFRLLLASLALTPIRLVFGVTWPIAFRRLLGLFAFAYVTMHFCVWLVLDHFFAWGEMGKDILKRPYITVGMTAFLLLMPLAATSTAAMIRRLGGRAWRRLHALVYAVGGLAALHFLWLAKVGRRDQYVYVAVLVLLLGVRAVDAARRWARGRRAPAGGARLSSARPI